LAETASVAEASGRARRPSSSGEVPASVPTGHTQGFGSFCVACEVSSMSEVNQGKY